MSGTPDFRNWAARVAGQATKERDAGEAQRLRSIAGYWERLADIELAERRLASLRGQSAPAAFLE
jgi:hypothetical protein